ncbi:beta strand repeat-containing protein [Ruegeria lacuscaerulensis]|uniref:beta strand repeat-containing protein n=1 Tax=Ruegeria lacuscaerulensis TaxID=55218 RepID=UPI00147E3EE0|nr:CHRD domain-containing protein [Ruegeria lacuscaerulensis]
MLSQLLSSLRARLLTSSTLAQETTRDGQTLINNFFQSTVVDDTPAFVLASDFSRLLNFGEIITNNAVAAVQAQGQDVDIFNFRSGRIEANNGPDALATGVLVTGSASIRNFGEIVGEFNGVQFAGAESSGNLDNFRGGVISSDSRAVDIQGQGIDVRNFGDIIGTGDQRNGTIYTNSTAEDISISNFSGGTIDAGEGNQGAGVSLQVGDEIGDRVETDIFNGFGATIQGRGQAASNTSLAGDGVRIDDGAEGAILEAEIVNSGVISTESDQGTAAGLRIADGANTEGEILNTSTGVIEGPRNGLYIGDGEHDLDVLNFGTIQSDSRAVNIDGSGVELINGGDILGTGDQRNGTVYADDTARDYSIQNLASGTIDAGEHNDGAGVSLSLAVEGNGDVSITNDGTIAGRGNAGAALGTAGDGIRLEGVRQEGGGFGPALFEGTITNTGTVTSEGANGTVGAFRAVNNVNFRGQLINEETGVLAGDQNGVYFGTGDHTGGSFVNRGTVTSDSRAVNIDGIGLDVVNEGEILGTGDQRNGTVYADGTADNYSFTNSGLVDAGEGNNGSAVSLQTGDESGDIVSAAVINEGTLQGRGDALEGNQVGDGLRLFTSQDDASFAGVVVNEGLIAGSEDSDAAAGIRVDGGLNLVGAILNESEIRGTVNAIDASDAGFVTIVNDDEGVINGNVLLSDGDDIFVDLGTTNGDISGGAGDDVLIAGDADNVITGGLGNDFIDGGEGIDTADFSDLDVAVEVSLDANGNGTAIRDTGFNVTVTDAVVAAPDQFGSSITNGAEFVEQAVQGNLYYNIHTSDFPAGEIRGQLLVDSDVTENGIRTVTLSGGLDASQEPGPTSDSEATGQATLVVTQNLETGEVTYSSELSVTGLNEADLLTPIPGVVSAVHLHNAPAGQNGPVVQDTLVDAGATLDTEATGGTGVIGEDVIDNQIEVDILRSIERVVGSDDSDTIDVSSFDGVTVDLDLSGPSPNPVGSGDEGPQDGAIIQNGQIVAEVDDFENVVGSDGDDLILGNNEFNILDGGAGNDAIHSFGGADVIIGGEGIDTALFTAGPGVVLDLDEEGNGVAQVNAPDGAILDQVFGFENINGSNNAGSPNGGDDILSGNSGSNTLNGQAGDDVLNGEGGDDILIGGAGNDTFVFEGNFGNDVIQDFEVGLDQLQFGDFGPDFGGSVGVAQDGDDAVISFGNEGSVRLVGINSADLNDDDFVA